MLALMACSGRERNGYVGLSEKIVALSPTPPPFLPLFVAISNATQTHVKRT